jgi:UDP-glucose 4-epimerase
MQPRRVLVTGVSRFLGGRLASLLSADPSIEAVIGVDTVEPRGDLGRTEVVRADIRGPGIAKVIASSEVDTVVHLSVVATPLTVGGRTAMKEINVIGTMQLLAACQKSPTVRKLVLKSTTAVYGSSPKDPALFTEELEPKRLPRTGYAKDSVEVEGYVRGFGRRRPDVALTMLRFTNFVGPRIDTPLTRYFSLPVVPTVFGFDPRIQFCHEDDAVEVLRRATIEDKPGIYNVGGEGVLLLSQAIRRAGRLSFPVLEPMVNLVGQGFRRAGLVDFSPEQMRFLEHGRVADTTRLREQFGYVPRYTSRAAFDDFVRARGLNNLLSPQAVADVEAAVLSRLPSRRSVHA